MEICTNIHIKIISRNYFLEVKLEVPKYFTFFSLCLSIMVQIFCYVTFIIKFIYIVDGIEFELKQKSHYLNSGCYFYP